MAVNTTATLSNNVTTALNKAVEMAFDPNLIFLQVAQSKMHENGMDARRGDSVDFTIYNRLNPALDTLSETASGTSDDISNAQKRVTLLEKGNYVTTTEKLKVTSFHDLDLTVADLVGRNAAESSDLFAREQMDAQTGGNFVSYGGTATSKATLAVGDDMTAALVRQTKVKLERQNVPVDPRFGKYIMIAHPDVIHDVRTETGDASFIDIARYASPEEALNNEIGMFGGFRWISSTLCLQEYAAGVAAQVATTVSGAHAIADTTVDVVDGTGLDAGDVVLMTDPAGDEWAYEIISRSVNELTINKAIRKNGNPYYATENSGLVTAMAGGEAAVEGVVVYSSYALGEQAMAYGWATRPEIRVSDDPTDAYGRLARVAWYGLHGVGELRAESLHKVFTSSSVGENA